MLDKERVLGKISQLDSYLNELGKVMPVDFEEYQKIEKKRSCERLLQLCVECALDICELFVSGLRLGLPSDENDLFDKMKKEKILSEQMASTLEEMRAFRNILIHEYATVDDELVFRVLNERLEDFRKFRNEILNALTVQ